VSVDTKPLWIASWHENDAAPPRWVGPPGPHARREWGGRGGARAAALIKYGLNSAIATLDTVSCHGRCLTPLSQLMLDKITANRLQRPNLSAVAKHVGEGIAHVAELDKLDAVRARFPTGEHFKGRVVLIPERGIGLFVDLGQEPPGFVDVLWLPREPGEWPPVGTVTSFEILQHNNPHQVRLFPLEDRFRDLESLPAGRTLEQWLVIKDRFPVGSAVTAAVTDVFPGNRTYFVRFEDCWSLLEWTGNTPRAGATGRYIVTKHLDRTRRIMLTPTDTGVM